MKSIYIFITTLHNYYNVGPDCDLSQVVQPDLFACLSRGVHYVLIIIVLFSCIVLVSQKFLKFLIMFIL